jgi:hypothetical protein
MFLVTINALANLSKRACVAFSDGAGTIGWHGGGFTGARFSMDEGAARVVRGKRRAVIMNVAYIMKGLYVVKIESRIELVSRETSVKIFTNTEI